MDGDEGDPERRIKAKNSRRALRVQRHWEDAFPHETGVIDTDGQLLPDVAALAEINCAEISGSGETDGGITNVRP